MFFKNRDQAALDLYDQLQTDEPENPIFLAIPAGGVPIAVALSRRFAAEIGLIMVRKLSHPGDPELAIGAVSEEGDIILGTVIDEYGISEEDAEDGAADEIERLRKLRRHYTGESAIPDLTGKTVVIVDDGIATGATAVTALRMVQRSSIVRAMIVAPVTSRSGRELLESEGAEVRTLRTVEEFDSISEFYEEFPPVTHEQVKELISLAKQPLS